MKRNRITQLKQIIRRLEKSESRRIARRNALRELDSLLKSLRSELRKKYPSIGKDGKAIVPKKLPKGERKCPTDGAYIPTAADFARHVLKYHEGKCWCGYLPRARRVKTKEGLTFAGAMSSKKEIAGLARHFSTYGDQLSSHLMMGAVQTMAKGQ